MCGLAFSGKSTLARKISEQANCKLVSFDQLWIETEKNLNVPQGVEGWRMIRELAKQQILASLKSGVSVVYDENNPKKEHRDEFRGVAGEVGSEAFVVYLKTPLEVVRSREQANNILHNRHEVSNENFDKVISDFEFPSHDENVLIFSPEDDINKFVNKL